VQEAFETRVPGGGGEQMTREGRDAVRARRVAEDAEAAGRGRL
jgi:hypothetical protein